MPWEKGQSGNPGGRPRASIEVREIRRLCQERSKEAYEVIAGLMASAEKETTRLAAAIAILKAAGVSFSEAPPVEDRPASPITGPVSDEALLATVARGEA